MISTLRLGKGGPTAPGLPATADLPAVPAAATRPDGPRGQGVGSPQKGVEDQPLRTHFTVYVVYYLKVQGT